MNESNTQTLFHSFPRLYLNFNGFECGDEYFDVIYKLAGNKEK